MALSLAVCVGFTNPVSCQNVKAAPDAGKRAIGNFPNPAPNPPAQAEPEKEKQPDSPLSPARQKALDRVKQAEKEFLAIDAAIEVHEKRIRTVRSIRVPPGVRPPQIDPVPLHLLQLRAQAWTVLQAAVKDFRATP